MRQKWLAAVAGMTVLVIQVAAGASEAPFATTTQTVVEVRPAGGLDPATGLIVDDVVRAARAESTIWHRVTLRLLSVTRDEAIVQQAPPGFGYPMLISALDPEAPVLTPELLSVIGRGEAIMGETTARIRGAEVGDSIDLESLGGEAVGLRIGAIVPEAGIRWSELVVGLGSAAALGIDRPFGIVIWGSAPARLQAALRLALPQESVQITGAGARGDATSDRVLPVPMVKERFGEFALEPGAGDSVTIDPQWFDEWIVDVDFPIVGPTRCNRMVVPYIRAALLEIQQAGLAAELDPVDFQIAGGCYNPRFNRGADPGYSLSRHTWGIAIDFNPTTNAYGVEPTMSPVIVDVFRRWGFSWGGSWSVPDGMHFEWTRLPDEYAAACSDLTMIEAAPANSWLLAPAGRSCS